MEPTASQSRQRRPRGLRGGIVIGVSIALVGIGVGTVAGAVTPFQMVIVKNTASEPVPVSGTVNVGNTPTNQQVTVSNFPATQAVSGTVSVGNFPAGPLATKRVTADLTTAEFGGFSSMQFAQMNVTTVIVADGDEDNFSVGIGGFRLATDHEGNFSEHFPAAFPATGLVLTCENAVLACDVTVTILGY